MPLLPVALYGLAVPAGDVIVPALPDFLASFRITMAAIDPTEEPEDNETSNNSRPRATLKLLRQPLGDSEDEDDEEYRRALIADNESDSDSEDSADDKSDEEVNGGPSDPAKSKKVKKEAAIKKLMESLGNSTSDEEMEDAPEGVNGANGIIKKIKKGKAKATDDDSEDSEEEDSDDEIEIEEFVLCTLDPEKKYQQPLDITIARGERVYFKVTGTHKIFLTGNYVIPDDDGHNHSHEVYNSEEDSDYDLSPDEDELEIDIDDESDELDGLDDPRITELDSDEEEAPKLVKTNGKKALEQKGKNKRTADDLEEGTSLDDLISKSAKPETAEEQPKLSKKQLKKLKKNNGEAAVIKEESVTPAKSDKSDKKVQFAKNLEQGPTGSVEKPKTSNAKANVGVKVVQGVTIDDRKVGTGKACKKGDQVGMRYIGKLDSGKVFDSNKAGKPFSFTLGRGEVIKGWDIGVEGMSIGGERRLTIPASLAYGKKKMGDIPANSTLTFDVKLLSIK